jgi:hypothetical protein
MKRRRRELGWIEDYDFERKFVVEVAGLKGSLKDSREISATENAKAGVEEVRWLE